MNSNELSLEPPLSLTSIIISLQGGEWKAWRDCLPKATLEMAEEYSIVSSKSILTTSYFKSSSCTAEFYFYYVSD